MNSKRNKPSDSRAQSTMINSFRNCIRTIKKNVDCIHLTIPANQDYFLAIFNSAQSKETSGAASETAQKYVCIKRKWKRNYALHF